MRNFALGQIWKSIARRFGEVKVHFYYFRSVCARPRGEMFLLVQHLFPRGSPFVVLRRWHPEQNLRATSARSPGPPSQQNWTQSPSQWRGALTRLGGGTFAIFCESLAGGSNQWVGLWYNCLWLQAGVSKFPPPHFMLSNVFMNLQKKKKVLLQTLEHLLS